MEGGRMVAQRKPKPSAKSERPPARTPEGRENQMIALAFDQAEKQMREGTASSQVITAFLKLGSSRERLEQEKIALENELTNAKKELMASQKNTEEMYRKALEAMRSYAGQEPLDDEDEFDD